MAVKVAGVIFGAAIAALTIGGPVSGKSAPARAGNSLSQPIPAAIKARYALVERLINEKGSAEAIGDALYWPDVIIAGEGGPTQRGHAEMIAGMPGTLDFIGSPCKFVFTDPAIVTPSVVAAYSGFSCKKGDKPDLKIRILYVWQKRGATWKVVRESYTMDAK